MTVTNAINANTTTPLVVSQGGTGDASLTAYSVLCGGTTGTAAVQSVASLGSSGQILTSNGAGALPTWQNNAGSSLTFVGRNRIINGDMQIWQRGAGGSASFAVPASTTQYTADRWQVSVGASTATTVTQTAGATSGSFLATIQRNSGQTGTATMYFCTSLTRDMCIGAAGNQLTLSFKALVGSNFSPTSNNITVKVYSGTGSTDISGLNGAFTGSTAVISQTQALTTTLTNYAFTSSAIGSNVTQLAVEFSWVPTGTAGANDYVEFTDVQLEVSPGQTPFDRLPFGTQFTNCQRFYYKTFNYNVAPATATGIFGGTLSYTVFINASVVTVVVPARVSFPTRMLVTPTVTFYNPQNANSNWYNLNVAADSGAGALQTSPQTAIVPQNTQVVGDLAGNSIFIHASADADVT